MPLTRLPSVEEIQNIADAVGELVATIDGPYLAEGHEVPVGFPGALRTLLLARALEHLERGLNPARVPFAELRRRYPMRGSGWPGPVYEAIDMIWDNHDSIVRQFGWEDIAAETGRMYMQPSANCSTPAISIDPEHPPAIEAAQRRALEYAHEVLRDGLKWATRQDGLQLAATDGGNLQPDDTMMGASAIGRLFRIAPDTARKRLRTWAKTNHNGWIESANPRSREARYLYQLGAVRHLFA